MKFKKICTKVEFLEKQDGENWIESTDIIAGRIAKSKLTGYGVIHSVSYPKCDVEIPDASMQTLPKLASKERKS